MIALDLLGASWRLDTPVRTPPAVCPVCAGSIVERCRCALGDAKCARGHEWHHCTVHNRTLQGPGDHSLRADVCQCHRSLTIGAFDLGAITRDLRGIKPITVSIAQTILRGGQTAIEQARSKAAARGLGGGARRDECYWKLQWHAAELAKLAATPNAIYGASPDLVKWTTQSFVEWNAVEEGAALLDAAWGAMWGEIKSGLAALPSDVLDKAEKGVSIVKWLVGGVVVVALTVGGWVVWRKVRR